MHTLVGMEKVWTLSTIEELFHTNSLRHTLDPCNFRIPSKNEGRRFNMIPLSIFERDSMFQDVVLACNWGNSHVAFEGLDMDGSSASWRTFHCETWQDSPNHVLGNI